MPTIAVVSFNDELYRKENPEVSDISFRNKAEYCMTHDYSLHIVTHSLVTDRMSVWSKLPLLDNLLRLHDWVFWADTDCLFMNYKIRLEDILDDHFSLIITKDMNGLSAGNFLLKRGEWATDFLKKSWDNMQCFDHWGQEQLAMESTLKQNPDMEDQVKYVQQNVLCSYYDVELSEGLRSYQEGDFIIHFPDHYGRRSLLELMRKFSAEVTSK